MSRIPTRLCDPPSVNSSQKPSSTMSVGQREGSAACQSAPQSARPNLSVATSGARYATALIGAFLALGLVGSSGEAQELEVIVLSGDAVPGGNVDRNSIGQPVAGQDNRALFWADISPGATQDYVILKSDGSALTSLFPEGFVVPGEGIELVDVASSTAPSFGALGEFVFNAEWDPVGSTLGGQGIFRYDEDGGGVVPVVLDGDSTADGNGQLNVILSNHPAIASNSQVAFWAEVYNAVGGFGNGSGIFRSEGSGSALARIVRTGQVPPLGSSYFEGFSYPDVNSSGEVAFVGYLDSGPEGIYRGSGGELTTIALETDELHPGWEIFRLDSGLVPINEDGVVAFVAEFSPPNIEAIFLGDGSGPPQRLVFGGQTPDAGQPGFLPYYFSTNVALNNREQVVFTGTGGPSTGIFRAEPGHVVAIAREDGPVPGTASGTFTNLWGYEFALNERGDVAFKAQFQAGGKTQTGLFLYTDQTGLLPAIVQEGTQLGGGVVEDIDFAGVGPEPRSGESTGLDETGRVVFRFELDYPLAGIAAYQSPVIFADGFESGGTLQW